MDEHQQDWSMMKFISIFLLSSFCFCLRAANIFSIHEGDSITQGAGSTGGSNYVFQLGQFINDGHIIRTNIGTSGDLIASNTAATDVLTQLASSGNYVMSLATIQFGINDISVSYTAPAIQSNYLTWISNVRASYPRTKIIQFTIMPSLGVGIGSDRDIVRSNVNNWIRTLSPVDAVVDMAGDSRLTPANTNYFSDIVHPNNLGYWVMASNAFFIMNASNFFDYRDRPIVSSATLNILR